MFMLLTACGEKQEYEQAVLAQFKLDKDVIDYKIDPNVMTKCVVSNSEGKMPGTMSLDPYRRKAYTNYTKMLQLNSSSDPKKMLEELRVDFGSAKKLSDAHSNYTESVVDCLSDLVSSSEQSSIKENEKK